MTLITAEIPPHVHRATAVAADVDTRSPGGALLGGVEGPRHPGGQVVAAREDQPLVVGQPLARLADPVQAQQEAQL